MNGRECRRENMNMEGRRHGRHCEKKDDETSFRVQEGTVGRSVVQDVLIQGDQERELLQ